MAALPRPPTAIWRPSWGAVGGAVVIGAGWVMGIDHLRDNSFLTHLATGRLILEEGGVPSTDPYSFTAPGVPWLVQSWLVSAAYAFVESLWGLGGVRILLGMVGAALAWLIWRLTDSAPSLIGRLLLAVLALIVGSGLWAERPFMLGLILFAAVMIIEDRQRSPYWLLPIGWIWVNSHGSFPLAFVYLVALSAGSLLDKADWRPAARCAAWLLAGVLLGAVGPLGLGALTFPVELLGRQDLLAEVVEWRAPTFDSLSQRAFLVQVAVAVLLLVRQRAYRDAVPAVVFVMSALLGMRNITVASLVLLPAMARGLGPLGTIEWRRRLRSGPLLLAGVVVLTATASVIRLDGEHLRLDAYPVMSLAAIEQGYDRQPPRVGTPVIVGNLMTFVYGRGDRVFYDDRFDMYPREISEAALALERGSPTLRAELEALDVELVVVERSSATAAQLAADPDWHPRLIEEAWVLFCKRPEAVSSSAAEGRAGC